jgi:hypothetical protein
MKSLKFASIALALGFAIQLGCGSDSGTTTSDGATIGGTGGMYGPEAGVSTGGTMPMDAAMGTGGMGGSVDAPMTGGAGGSMDGGMGGMMVDAAMPMDGPMVTMDSGTTMMDGGGEAGVPATNICTGLTAAACHLAIITAPVETGILEQEPPAGTPPNYLVCSQ